MSLSVFLLILIFGILTSYTDIAKGKIKNSIIIIMIITALLTNLFITKSLLITPKKFLVNAAFSFLTSIIIWLSGLWTAGDAKLFFAYSILLPQTIYVFGTYNFFPSFTILVNTFVPMSIYIFLTSIKHIKREHFIQEAKKIYSPKELLPSFLTLLGLIMASNIIFSFLKIEGDFVSSIFFIFLIFYLIKNKKILFLISSTFIILSLILQHSHFSFNFLANTLLIFLVFQFFRVIIQTIQDSNVRSVKINEIKEGMLLAKPLVKNGNVWMNYSEDKPVQGKVITILNKEDVLEIKNAFKEKKLKLKELEIYNTIPFAPLLFFGVVLTFFAKGNVFIHLITAKDIIVGYLRYWFAI